MEERHLSGQKAGPSGKEGKSRLDLKVVEAEGAERVAGEQHM